MYDAIALWMSQLNIPLLTIVSKLIDNDFIFLAITLLIAFLAKQGKKRNRLLLSLILIFAFGSVVKFLVHEPRPCLVFPSKVACPGSASFPSSHAVVAFALAAGLWKKPNGWIYFALAVFVAFTRLYLGVHTLLDVVGGMILGVAGYWVIDKAWQKLPDDVKKPLSGILE